MSATPSSPENKKRKADELSAGGDADEPVHKKARGLVRHLYVPYGTTMMWTGADHRPLLYTCSDPKRAAHVNTLLRNLLDAGANDNGTCFELLLDCVRGEDRERVQSEFLEFYDSLVPSVADETWEPLESDFPAGPFDSVTLYYLDCPELY